MGKAGPSIHVQYLVLTTRGTFGDGFGPQPDESEPDVARVVTPLADFPFLSYFAESTCKTVHCFICQNQPENRSHQPP